MRRLIVVMVLVSVVMVQNGVVKAENKRPFPEPTGKYQVGTVVREWTDTKREELLTGEPGDQRKLLIQIWYPTEAKAAEGGKFAPYLRASDETLKVFSALIEASRGVTLKLPLKDFAAYESHSIENAPIATDKSGFPVLVFSPGFGATPQMYTTQIEDVASHGYVVVAINHVYATAAAQFLDGTVAQINPRYNAGNNFNYWVLDQVFVLDQIEAMNTDDKLFGGKLDVKHIGAFGHSLGGGVSLKTATLDTRIAAVLSEDSPELDERMDKALQQPLMLMNSALNVGGNEAVYEQAKSAAYQLTMNTFYHDNFGDMAFWEGVEPLKGAQALGTVDAKRANEIVNAYIVAFFDKHLKGEAVALLDKQSTDYQEVTFKKK